MAYPIIILVVSLAVLAITLMAWKSPR